MSSKGTIWLVNKEAAPSNEYATHMRTIRQAQYFQRKGYEVRLFCSAVVHNTKIVHRFEGTFKEEEHDGVKMVFVKCPEYGESSVKRVWAFFVFSLNMFKAKAFPKPDIIIHESKTPFDILLYWVAKRNKSRYIVDIEDLWPYELEHFGLISKKNPLLKVLYRMERWLYAHSEHTVISSEGGQDYMIERKWDKAQGGPIDLAKIHYVNNGLDLKEYQENVEKYQLEDADLEDKDTFKVIYLGSIRLANHLDSLLDAAKALYAYPNIRVLVFGDGTERQMLEERCEKEQIKNVIFKNKWIELKYVPYVLSKADINLLNYGHDWAPYGGSMNKMIMSFASGKPIVSNAGMPYSEISRHELGIDKVFESPQEYAEAILSIYKLDKSEYEKVCGRVREVAKRYDINYLCEKFAEYCEIQ